MQQDVDDIDWYKKEQENSCNFSEISLSGYFLVAQP